MYPAKAMYDISDGIEVIFYLNLMRVLMYPLKLFSDLKLYEKR